MKNESHPMAIDDRLDELFDSARTARDNAHAPYSGYHVGAAILDESGRIFAGCNVENSSYGLTVCAERNAMAAACAAGCRRPVAIVILTSDGAMPCGACRQVLVEFNPDIRVIAANPEGITKKVDVAGLLPDYFTLNR